MSGYEWAVLGVYLAASVIVGCVFGLLIRAARALMYRRSDSRFSLGEWIQAVNPDADFHRQVMDAIYAEHDRMVDVPASDLVWVMSQEWSEEIRAIAGANVSALNYAQHRQTVDALINQTMLGIRVEIRDSAGFPKLAKLEDA